MFAMFGAAIPVPILVNSYFGEDVLHVQVTLISAIGVRNVVENHIDFTKFRNLIIAGVIFVCGPGFSDGLTFTVAGTSITLTFLAIAAIAGIFLNAILPGNDYHFGKDLKIDANRGLDMIPNLHEDTSYADDEE
mgnify:FL=1